MISLEVDGLTIQVETGSSVLAAIAVAHERFPRCRVSVTGEERGPVCGMGVCFECVATVDGCPHTRTCLLPAREGMVISTRRPGLPPIIEAGSKTRLDYPVVVVGGGPAGMSAALASARMLGPGKVLLIDENPQLGGQIYRANLGLPNTHVMERQPLAHDVLHACAVVDAYGSEGHFELAAVSDNRVYGIHAERIVLATGARELFLPFPGWTLPGVTGIGGLQAMVKSGLPIEGQRVLIAGSGPLLLAVAAGLCDAGAKVVGVYEQAPFRRLVKFAAALVRHPAKLLEGARYRHAIGPAPYRCGTWIQGVLRSRSGITATLTDGRRPFKVDCDLAAVAWGLVPNTELARLLGCAVTRGRVCVDGLLRTSVDGIFAAGEAVGIAGVEVAVAEGLVAGSSAAEGGAKLPPGYREFAHTVERAFALRPEVLSLSETDTVLCRCEDVPLGAIAHHAAREAKVMERCGMGPCQGRICHAAGREILGWTEDTIRPPLLPRRTQ